MPVYPPVCLHIRVVVFQSVCDWTSAWIHPPVCVYISDYLAVFPSVSVSLYDCSFFFSFSTCLPLYLNACIWRISVRRHCIVSTLTGRLVIFESLHIKLYTSFSVSCFFFIFGSDWVDVFLHVSLRLPLYLYVTVYPTFFHLSLDPNMSLLELSQFHSVYTLLIGFQSVSACTPLYLPVCVYV